MEQNEPAKLEPSFNDVLYYCVCVLVTLDVLFKVKLHWYALDWSSKILGVALVAYLILMPLGIMRGERKGRKYGTAQMLFFAYISVMMAIQVFSSR